MQFFLATPILLASLAISQAAVCQQNGVISWGHNGYGQVSNTPPGQDFKFIAGGHYHSLALHHDGSVVGWGSNSDGQTSVPPGFDFAFLAAGGYHSHAIKEDGSIVSWGKDSDGQVSGTPPGTGFVQADAGKYHSLALNVDGSITSWGFNRQSQVTGTPPGNDFIQIAAGSFHSLALRSDGSIDSWGEDNFGTVSGTPTDSGFIQIAGGAYHSLALRVDGSIIGWGEDIYGVLSNIPTESGFTYIDGGGYHALAVKSDGTVVCWGNGQYGQTTPPSGELFGLVGAGFYHSLALTAKDSDADGIFDSFEDVNWNGIVDLGETDPFDQDTDDDGLGDGEEVYAPRLDSRWIQGPSGDFYRLEASETWSTSSAYAREMGYDLASVQDQFEADWLFQTFAPVGGSFWIGLSDFSGTMEWSDGTPVSFTNWATGEPGSTFVAAFIGDQASTEPARWYADFAGLTERPAVWKSPGPSQPMTATSPLLWDSDGDGLGDGMEDGLDSIYWDGHGLPGILGTDAGVFIPDADPGTITDPLDIDSDEDGIPDGEEDSDRNGAANLTETDPANPDSDADSLTDGLESGLIAGTFDTDGNVFVPDSDPLTTTDPLLLDSDLGGVPDGVEDQNGNGAVDTWETDPSEDGDEAFAAYLSGVIPGQTTHIEVWNATPYETIIPVYSLAGGGPSSTGIGVTLDLTRPVSRMEPFLSDGLGRGSVDRLRVPPTAPIGLDVWFQAVEIPLGSVLPPRVSNPVLLPVGAN